MVSASLFGGRQSKYHYLDLKPETVTKNGRRFTRRALQHWGPASCFAQNDLYTVKAGSFLNTEIEQFFFGEIDRNGKAAVEYFDAFSHPSADDRAFSDLMTYMSVQKLRTPKGLGWLAQVARNRHRNLTLIQLQTLQTMFCAIWSECVWQIGVLVSGVQKVMGWTGAPGDRREVGSGSLLR